MLNTVEKAVSDAYDTAITQPLAEMNILQKMANKLTSLVIIYAAILTFAAVFFSYSEGKDITDSFWWAAVTATTVGYGDMYPTHPWGRFVAATLMHLSVFLIAPVITAKLAAHMIVDSDAFTHTEQEEMKRQIRDTAEALERIEAAIRTNKA